ncbi:MAG TPA: metalloregulator ArsR/SmtB family transcription factor [Sedimenticola thiotaurini]|uniref:Metalloregulator ArsR/SmtB family transcription factor n=1 Tax=Sedimenticola thiotaurini TaxID=1543721 RepID=A0A831RJ04_9GAMM|nr:metalloregulator ArsR/SmtB family transcription factor [Sedimenticola thiotaurini]
MDAPALFKALSDPTRLRCLVLLTATPELCVCEFTEALGIPQPKVSHHLAILRRAALVTDRKQGLWIHYSINPRLPSWAGEVIRAAADGIRGEEPYASDAAALAGVSGSGDGLCNA